MSRYRLCIIPISVVSSFVLMISSGCDRGPARIKIPKVDPSTAAAKAMTMYDANNDGRISGDEFERCDSLRRIARNGAVTAELLTGVLDQWQRGTIARVFVALKVFHNGRPLAKASVKVVPEEFLGTNIQSATAITNADGGVSLSVPTSPGIPQGLSIGFYRIEVTKDGENIPSKYNTDTTLGIAVLDEVPGLPLNLLY